MNNKYITEEQFVDFHVKTYTFPRPTFGEISYFFGYAMLPAQGGYLLFKTCEYCGSHDGQVKRNLLREYVCAHCSAPIRWSDKVEMWEMPL